MTTETQGKTFFSRLVVGRYRPTVGYASRAMGIKEDLAAELVDALKAKDQPRKDAIRSVETDVARAKSEAGFEGEVDDELYVKVIASYVKKMSKAVSEYEDLGERGQEMAGKLRFETEYLSRWLPEKMSEDETRDLVATAIGELGVDDPSQSGQVMGHIMKTHKSAVDGSLVKRLVGEALGG